MNMKFLNVGRRIVITNSCGAFVGVTHASNRVGFIIELLLPEWKFYEVIHLRNRRNGRKSEDVSRYKLNAPRFREMRDSIHLYTQRRSHNQRDDRYC